MTESTTNKQLAIAVSLSIVLAFCATTKTHATTQFPPAHSSAEFTEVQEINDNPVAGSYYRPNAEHTIDVQIRNSGVELAYSNVRISPYYRSAN